MERWTPENSEQEPEAKLNTPSGEFVATRENARLFTHLGKLAIYDHVFCSNEQTGFYIFNFISGYNELKDYMMKNNYPAHINQTEVAQVDVDAYERLIAKSLEDTDHIPDDWK